ncbi:hypothetical protein B484DRAFT_472977 [Ochromonadaceae sp. CCMP2298]|nr:hypothetical protein B484DRAFT_472977 [Ochromonadaceae sp. CCMP2298]
MGNQISLPSRRIFVTICASSLLLLPVAQVRATYADIDLSNTASGSQVSTLQGAAANGYLGTSVSDAGDVNKDGFADIVVGADHASPNGRVNAGAVLFGRAGGFSTVDLAGFVSSDSTGYMIQGASEEASLGSSVSGAGDANKDGLADVLVGASGASLNGRTNAGAVYVV